MQNKTITPSLAGVVTALALTLSGGAKAQTAGSWLVRAGATQIAPQVTSGDLSAPSFTGTKVDVHADTQLAGGITSVSYTHLTLPTIYSV